MQKNKFLSLALLFIMTLTVSFTTHSYQNKSLLARQDVQTFIQHMVNKHHFERKQLETWLGQAKIQPSILTTIAKPAEVKPWYQYQAIFLTPERIRDGVNFWRTHAHTLAKAEKTYGVPAEIIVAIIGVETFYGKRTGDHKVLDALVTLGFDYPPRAKFFLSELEQFFLLAREEHWDPTKITGSYAGAMGKPQFISSSYRRFAVDFNDNGKRDLLHNADDAIGSVANYFHRHGWQPAGDVIFPAKVKGNHYENFKASKGNPKPQFALYTMKKLGVDLAQKKDVCRLKYKPFALVALQGEAGPEYWLGAQNFYVITRYNHSDHYAMAVYTLSQEIKQAHQQGLSQIS